MSHNDPRNDPLSGYRPDMDEYRSHKDVHEEVDEAFRMLAYIIMAFFAVICVALGFFFWSMIK